MGHTGDEQERLGAEGEGAAAAPPFLFSHLRDSADAASGLDLRSTVDRVVLFESVTGGGPARYVPLETVRLRPAAGAQ